MSSQEKEASPVKFSFRRTWQHNSNNEGFRGLFGCGTEACSMFRSTTLPAVKKFTDPFAKASERALGWSTGAHGLRHSYAQDRLKNLTKNSDYETAKETVS